jgi:arsenate reductase
LKNPIDESTLRNLMAFLPNPPADMVRKDGNFADLGLDEADYTTEDEVVDLLMAHPVLMQRPIAVVGERAVIGRPSELVFDVLQND